MKSPSPRLTVEPATCRFRVLSAIISAVLAGAGYTTTATATLNAGSAAAAEYFVAPNGNDAHPGTREQPFATVEKALAASAGNGPCTIWLAPGEYFVEKGLTLDKRHSGEAARPFEIRGIEPRTARLTGARVVSGFRPIAPDEANSLISAEARQKVVVADLKALGFPPLAELPSAHRDHGCEELIFGDEPMQSARWPNEGFVEFDEVTDSGASGVTHWVEREVYRPGAFRFPGDRAKSWDFQHGVWLHGFWCYEWSDEALKAASYDAATGELRLAAKHRYGIGSPWNKKSKHPFYALHVFEELDRPGEYYLDRKANRLYFWPPAGISSAPVRLTLCRRPLIRADGAQYLTLRDLVIENGCDAGAVIVNGHGCRMENCLVRNTGRQGITLAGAEMVASRCEVTATGGLGISVSGGDRKTLTPGKCAIEHCHVHHVGRWNWEGGRCATMHGCGNRMANNLFHHAPTGAVAYGGNEHLLELNSVHDVCIHYADVGVFYTGRDWASRGNVVRWNFVRDVAPKGGFGAQAFYLDDCDSGDSIIGNIVFRCGNRAVVIGGGRDNVIRGNVFVDQPIGVHVDARGPKGIVFDRPDSWNLLAKCQQVEYQSPLWRERYPALARVMDENPLMPMGNVIRGNLMIGCRKPFDLRQGVDPAWLDRADNLERPLSDFPKLIDEALPTKLDLSQLPKIWAELPGFEPIPIERIGPRP